MNDFQSARKQLASRDDTAFEKSSSALRDRLKRSPTKRTPAKDNASRIAVAFQDSTNSSCARSENSQETKGKTAKPAEDMLIKLRRHLISRGHAKATVDACQSKEQLLHLLDLHPSTKDEWVQHKATGEWKNPKKLPSCSTSDATDSQPTVPHSWFAGTSGLLKTLGAAAEQVSLEIYRGSVVGVDGSSWLHESLAHAGGLPLSRCKDAVIAAVLSRCNVCRDAGLEIVLVFDGVMDEERRERRATALSEQEGCDSEEKFAQRYAAAVRIESSRSLVVELLNNLTEEGFAWMQAPRAASGQLAALAGGKLIAAVITNDIDCLVLGCSTVLLHTQFSADATAKQIQYENLFSFEGAVHQPVLGWLNGQEVN